MSVPLVAITTGSRSAQRRITIGRSGGRPCRHRSTLALGEPGSLVGTLDSTRIGSATCVQFRIDEPTRPHPRRSARDPPAVDRRRTSAPCGCGLAALTAARTGAVHACGDRDWHGDPGGRTRARLVRARRNKSLCRRADSGRVCGHNYVYTDRPRGREKDGTTPVGALAAHAGRGAPLARATRVRVDASVSWLRTGMRVSTAQFRAAPGVPGGWRRRTRDRRSD